MLAARPHGVRWAHHTLDAAPLAATLRRMASVDDVALTLGALTTAQQAAVWRLAAVVAEMLPAALDRSLAALRRGELDALLIDGEPERDDLPDTLDGVDRRYAGSLLGDWLGLAYALRLGVGSAVQMSTGHLRIEWQIGSEALHRDAISVGEVNMDGPWAPRMPIATYSTLRCVRPGSNPRVRTAVVHRAELLNGLGGHLEALARPVYRCGLLDRTNPPPGDRRFAVVVRHPEGGWDMSPAALESSLHLVQRAGGGAITCEDPRGRDAIAAFVAARHELERYPEGVAWRAGRRMIVRQAHCYHGRREGITPTTAASWASERWLSRLNLMAADGAPAVRPIDARRIDEEVDRLRGPAAEAKRRWLARQDESAALLDVARASHTSGW